MKRNSKMMLMVLAFLIVIVGPESAVGKKGKPSNVEVLVEMTGIDVTNGTSTTDLEVEVDYQIASNNSGDPVAVSVGMTVFAERCLDGIPAFFPETGPLDLETEPQSNCLRETYRQAGASASTGAGGNLWVSFNDLPPGNYLFKIELSGDVSGSRSFRHGWVAGAVSS